MAKVSILRQNKGRGSGDRFAFEILVSRHQTKILNTIYRFVGNRTDAENLAQEVFLRIWLAGKRYKPTAKFTTWAYRITANLCINQLKTVCRKRLFQLDFTSKKTLAKANEYLANKGEEASSPETEYSGVQSRPRHNCFNQHPPH